MNKSESIKSLASALSLAQNEIENATKNAKNPHFKNNYADLAEVLNTVRPVFSKHGLSVIQFPGYESGIVSVETVLAHASGEYISSTSSCKTTKDDAQGVGSCITYLRRYSLAAVAGIAQEDDDGNAASRSTASHAPAFAPRNVEPKPFVVADACAAIIGAPNIEVAIRYADAAIARARNDEERARIHNAVETYKEAA